ncbi:MAG: hypothetical protein GY754_17115 [bacterium]|nr:hypothetical protein [bacterium]
MFKSGKTGTNLTGVWTDPSWGKAVLIQEGNRLSGTLGDYYRKITYHGKVKGYGISLSRENKPAALF